MVNSGSDTVLEGLEILISLSELRITNPFSLALVKIKSQSLELYFGKKGCVTVVAVITDLRPDTLRMSVENISLSFFFS